MMRGVAVVALLVAGFVTTLAIIPDAPDPNEDEGNNPLPYLGEIRWVTFKYAPRGWAICHGQYVGMDRFRSLLTVLRGNGGQYEGSTYGMPKNKMFALPNLLDAPVNETSTMTEDEVQILTKDLDLVPIIALEGSLPTAPRYPIIHPDKKFSIEAEDLKDLDTVPIPRAPPARGLSESAVDEIERLKSEDPSDLPLEEKRYK